MTKRDKDILRICPNCSQWVRKSNGNDCLNQCRRRGLFIIGKVTND